jgi:hypothetical protein
LEGLREAIELAGKNTRFDGYSLVDRVDLNAFHQRQVEYHPIIAAAIPGEAMTTRTDRG